MKVIYPKTEQKDGDITTAVKIYIKFQIWVFCLIMLLAFISGIIQS